MAKPPLSRRGVERLSERERSVGLDPKDEAADWLEQNDPAPEPARPRSASKSKTLHRWRQQQQQRDKE